jgi:flagellar biosynthesis protein FlhG
MNMAQTRKTNASGPSVRPSPAPKPVRTISVTSGKGGVGKTNIVTNLAIALAQAGQKVLVWDADLGLANIDVLLGLKPAFNIHHLLAGEKSLTEILVQGPGGFKIMPASSGIEELANLGEGQKMRLLSEFDDYDDDLDFLLIDTGAGISSNVIYFNLAAQAVVVVVTPEPTSITDAYALIKVMSTRYNYKRFKILPNQVTGPKEAKGVFSLLANVSDQHLSSVALDYIGFIPKDEHLLKSVRQQRAVLDLYPSAEISENFTKLARFFTQMPPEESLDGNIRFFWKRMLKI